MSADYRPLVPERNFQLLLAQFDPLLRLDSDAIHVLSSLVDEIANSVIDRTVTLTQHRNGSFVSPIDLSLALGL